MKQGKLLNLKQIKKLKWADIVWIEIYVDKGAGHKLRMSEPSVVIRSDETVFCVSVESCATDDQCVDVDGLSDDTLTEFYFEDCILKFYRMKKRK